MAELQTINVDDLKRDLNNDDIVGFALEGDIYCTDCTIDLAEDEDELRALCDDSHRDGGPVHGREEFDGVWHCGRHRNCRNAIPGEEHAYHHSNPIGAVIETRVFEYDDVEVQSVERDGAVVKARTTSFEYRFVLEAIGGTIELTELDRMDLSTGGVEKYEPVPEGVPEWAAEELVDILREEKR